MYKYATSLGYKPPKFYASATYTSKVHAYTRMQLQSFVVSEEQPVQRKVKNIHDDFAVPSSRTAILSVMYHNKFPESAATSCTRVAAR